MIFSIKTNNKINRRNRKNYLKFLPEQILTNAELYSHLIGIPGKLCIIVRKACHCLWFISL